MFSTGTYRRGWQNKDIQNGVFLTEAEKRWSSNNKFMEMAQILDL